MQYIYLISALTREVLWEKFCLLQAIPSWQIRKKGFSGSWFKPSNLQPRILFWFPNAKMYEIGCGGASDTSSFIVLMTAHRLHTKPQHTTMYMQLNRI